MRVRDLGGERCRAAGLVMAEPQLTGPDPATYKKHDGAPGATPGASPDQASFIGDIQHLGAELFRSVFAVDISKSKPFIKPTPFAITYVLPHVFGGLVPNESFGLSPDLGMTAIPQAVIVPGGADINSETQRLFMLQEAIQREQNVREAAQGWDNERIQTALALARGRAKGSRPQADITVAFLENLLDQRLRKNVFLGPVLTTVAPLPSIESRTQPDGAPSGVNWPSAGGITNALSIFGFIDALVAALPPDP